MPLAQHKAGPGPVQDQVQDPVPGPSPPYSVSYICSSVVVVMNSSISLLPSWSLRSGVLGFGAISSSSETKSWLSKQRQMNKGTQISSPWPTPPQGWSQGPSLLPLLDTHTLAPWVSARHREGFAVCQNGSAGRAEAVGATGKSWLLTNLFLTAPNTVQRLQGMPYTFMPGTGT